MPQIFKIGSYWVFFWANESDPLDPVHVYVCEGAPNANATKPEGLACDSSRLCRFLAGRLGE